MDSGSRRRYFGKRFTAFRSKKFSILFFTHLDKSTLTCIALRSSFDPLSSILGKLDTRKKGIDTARTLASPSKNLLSHLKFLESPRNLMVVSSRSEVSIGHRIRLG